ncbi:MAG TPA: ABC transporter ATP-binding protein, partial [Aggregatilineaceae bacterium]|nr:ABC transporter ATP-binding protein [Aggregatilineaceae bacterium]
MSIQLIDIGKTYPDDHRVLENVTLEVQAGELFVLLGASGSGKSSLLRIIAGLTPPTTGRVRIHGIDVTDLPPQKRNVGFVFQNYSLFQHMSVAANVGFALDVNATPRAERTRRVAELLDLIGLSAYAQRLPRQLSGGQQQRVALARALAHEPGVLLLDEPFGALDAQIRGQLRQSLREIQQRLKVTAILVTHDQEEAFELADRIGIIDHGRLVDIGTSRDLYQRPHHRFTASFLGTTNFLHAERRGSGLRLGLAQLEAGTAVTSDGQEVMLRPENVTLAPTADRVAGQLLGQGVVENITFMGPFQRVTVATHPEPSSEPLVIQALVPADEPAGWSIRVGECVWVGIRAYSLLPYTSRPGAS